MSTLEPFVCEGKDHDFMGYDDDFYPENYPDDEKILYCKCGKKIKVKDLTPTKREKE